MHRQIFSKDKVIGEIREVFSQLMTIIWEVIIHDLLGLDQFLELMELLLL